MRINARRALALSYWLLLLLMSQFYCPLTEIGGPIGKNGYLISEAQGKGFELLT